VRIVFFTSEGFDSDELFLYMYAHVAASYNDVHIVAVCQGSSGKEGPGLVKRYLRTVRPGPRGHAGDPELVPDPVFHPQTRPTKGAGRTEGLTPAPDKSTPRWRSASARLTALML
jgi:hypothetical protein